MKNTITFDNKDDFRLGEHTSTFFVDENQVIRFAVGSTATSSSSPLGK